MNDHPATPPALPGPYEPAEMNRKGGLFSAFGDQFRPAEGGLTFFQTIDALLKRPGQIAHEIIHGDVLRVAPALIAVLLVCMAAYGALMASFSGGAQFWVVPLKVCLGYLFSALICLPSLYIFVCLSGGRLSLGQVALLLLQSLALSALLLAGFAPIMWIFSQSTSAIAFMGFLHVLFWGVSACFALRLLGAAVTFVNRRPMGILTLWSAIFITVVFQMATFLRPLVGPFDGLDLHGKLFFLTHWMQTLGQ